MPLSEFDADRAVLPQLRRAARRCRASASATTRRCSTCPPGVELVAAIDTLVDGVHFPHGSPACLDRPSRARGESERSGRHGRAAGWALLALTLPQARRGLAVGVRRRAWPRWRARTTWRSSAATRRPDRSASPCRCWGTCRASAALLRSGGRAGRCGVCVGTPGDAAAGLALEQGALRPLPSAARAICASASSIPRRAWRSGERLRGYASACIDVSDGLLGDAASWRTRAAVACELAYRGVPRLRGAACARSARSARASWH